MPPGRASVALSWAAVADLGRQRFRGFGLGDGAGTGGNTGLRVHPALRGARDRLHVAGGHESARAAGGRRAESARNSSGGGSRELSGRRTGTYTGVKTPDTRNTPTGG